MGHSSTILSYESASRTSGGCSTDETLMGGERLGQQLNERGTCLGSESPTWNQPSSTTRFGGTVGRGSITSSAMCLLNTPSAPLAWTYSFWAEASHVDFARFFTT